MRVRVKICCIATAEEASRAVSAGASAIGLVSEMPSGPGVIDEWTAGSIVPVVPRGVETFLLTSRRDAMSIVAQQQRTRATTLQLVDSVGVEGLEALRERLPGVSLVQVVHVLGAESLEQAIDVESHVDAVLLDSGNPNLSVKQLGGTGRIHDWEISRLIVEALSCPVYLAGGLNPNNVESAIDAVGPYGVDVCSGVRTDGALDTEKLESFMAAANPPAPEAGPQWSLP